jgi:hypothetical protein
MPLSGGGLATDDGAIGTVSRCLCRALDYARSLAATVIAAETGPAPIILPTAPKETARALRPVSAVSRPDSPKTHGKQHSAAGVGTVRHLVSVWIQDGFIVEQVELADPVDAWNIDFITALRRVLENGRKSN